MSQNEKNKRELLTKLLQKKLSAKAGEKSVKKYPDDIIAIVGVSGRYPMADNIDMFWENLLAGRDCVTEIPETRWN
ncbi:MAG: beta-ketoacyl synthase N-terminal-like domain-containing protein, partial [Candidatus Saccharibacteria bacterium]|nr:beta-ketoacyl synthase N-terminal-like domain-containing protein [Candidatus Saccharibacteria bacterium]